MTSFTKPEVHNVLHCRQRRTDPRPGLACTEIFVKFEHVVIEWDMRTYRTYRHAARNTSHPYTYWGRSIVSDNDNNTTLPALACASMFSAFNNTWSWLTVSWYIVISTSTGNNGSCLRVAIQRYIQPLPGSLTPLREHAFSSVQPSIWNSLSPHLYNITDTPF